MNHRGSAYPFAVFDHLSEMVRLVGLHHLADEVFGFVAVAELPEGEDVMHVGSVVDGENLEPRAAFVGRLECYPSRWLSI